MNFQNLIRFLLPGLLCLFSCSAIKKPSLETRIILKDKVDSVVLGSEVLHGIFYPVQLELTNNTDSACSFWTNSCSWQSNWIFEGPSLIFLIDCPKNVPVLMKVDSRETIIFTGIIQTSGTKCMNDSCKNRLGFVLVNKSECATDSDFVTLLMAKIKNKKDMFWTDYFIIRE